MKRPVTTSGTALRNLRRTRTITQADLARLVGVSQRTISAAETGRLRLSFDLQARIAAILGSTRQELFPPEETPNREAVSDDKAVTR